MASRTLLATFPYFPGAAADDLLSRDHPADPFEDVTVVADDLDDFDVITEVPDDAVPENALIGVRIYVPDLHLRVPFLPDLGFDDLREIDLPQPIVRLSYVRDAIHPEWLEGRSTGFEGWSGHGPVPDMVRERFPDR